MYAIIVNPYSGRKKATQLFQQVEQLLNLHNMPYKVLLSDSKDASNNFLKKLLESSSLTAVVVIGGDGTTGSVVQFASKNDIPLAILPAGSGNDAARAFGLSLNPLVFVEKLKDFSVRQVDLLNVDGKFGITIAAAGVDAEIGEKANHSIFKVLLNKLGLGGVIYPIAAIQTLVRFSPFEVDLSIDNEQVFWPRTWLIAAGNTPSYGGGLRVCPEALTNDGVMHITVAHSASRPILLLNLFPKLLQGNPIQSPSITYFTATAMTLQANRNILLILDGEPIHSTSFTICIQAKALRLVDTSEQLIFS
ncbi:diacylglycerol/lipid kinase family protein [Sporosarcina gallistercoris]|uniref:YegS/Rv2252/BmrU family lipid kinase n=1 Tax=Sporosarcina gallistercoris TaxID=2762245 RepID=A0ABR8PJH5_9BACL|nr:YegS/Rv2252/BmrU family lipid kinase [Sporosarcina gallistercoris]MBD7908345.1 YegS/Rv2252/BmrU family lipid kinase [Sporosarcina gallistercoris]